MHETELTQKARRQKRKAPDDGEEADSDDEAENRLAELRDKVNRMTERMDGSMRKLIDGRHNVRHIHESLAATAEEARATASTQASTQHLRSQARPRRGSASGSDAEDEDEYQAFQPTDPAAGTRAPPSALTTFRNKVEDAKTRYQSHSLYERYAQDNDYVSFRRVVHDALYPDGDVPVPDPHTWFPEGDLPAPGITARRQDVNSDDDDDDIAVERVNISTKCPLTLQEFKDPLSSRKCRHSFEKTAIMEMLRHSQQRVGNERAVQCPVPGCSVMLTNDDMHHDAVLLRKIKRLQRAKELEEQEEDEDEEDGTPGGTQRNATIIDDDDDGDDAGGAADIDDLTKEDRDD
jgi:E3 SUMO-protein ligase NSE2